MNYPLCILNYLLQTKEYTGKLDAQSAIDRLEMFRKYMQDDEYRAALDIIQRIARIAGTEI